ncbi:MAG TPA: cadmium-containing carbonic anhydrase [Candidatus Saccharibacteria bacterium]|nr:cadmium-containing carbonic anhydrase [Candidatus Saccharibacteria bacterium]
MNYSEKERETVVVECIAPDGLGFGEGGISVKSQIEQGILMPNTPRHIHEFLINNPNAFKQVEVDDDGCGDGRPWTKIIQEYRDENGDKKVQFFGKSKLRAKVFGGGLVTAASMWRAIQGVPRDEQTVGGDRVFMSSKLAIREFSHGAHSDDHAEGENCGCGAIDKYPVITANAIKYRPQITGVLEALYGDEFENNKSEIEQVFGVYEALAESNGYFADASGKQSMEQILDSGAVVKELAGHHIEETIVINDVEGTTLDQQFFTETVKNAGRDERPRIVQAFSVDVWRGKAIVDEVVEIAHEEDPMADLDQVRKLAYADFLIRTLAVAGTLTAGDLPVYERRTV